MVPKIVDPNFNIKTFNVKCDSELSSLAKVVLKSFLREKFVDLSIYRITSEHFAKFRDQRLQKIKPATFVRQIGIIKHFFNTAIIEWNFNIKNPINSIRKKLSFTLELQNLLQSHP